jgi:hypothetical protein
MPYMGDAYSDAETDLPAWLLVRRVAPGQDGFEEMAAWFVAADGHDSPDLGRADVHADVQLFVLADPAAEPDEEPAAMLLAVIVEDRAAIAFPAGTDDDLLGRLLASVADGLRARGVQRAVASSSGLRRGAASVLERAGFRSQGASFVVEL